MVKRDRQTRTAEAYTKKSLSKAPNKAEATVYKLGTEALQRGLNIFAEAFHTILQADTFNLQLQQIKSSLFSRDFAAAFGNAESLPVYAARWSPTRALCYANILLNISHRIDERLISSHAPQRSGVADADANLRSSSSSSASSDSIPLQVVCLGGCAAELVALGLFLHDASPHLSASVTLVDSAPWDDVISLLHKHLITPPQLSKYASAKAQAENKAMIQEQGRLSVRFVRRDVLELCNDQQQRQSNKELALLSDDGVTIKEQPLLVTLLFTLNELYTSGGIAKTTRMLCSLGQSLPNGSLLLVVDSPGSYSDAAVGRNEKNKEEEKAKEKKKYPMQWLLDHTLLEKAGTACAWQKLDSQDSSWFRLPDSLTYPIPLEDMRYQMHLYQLERSGDATTDNTAP